MDDFFKGSIALNTSPITSSDEGDLMPAPEPTPPPTTPIVGPPLPSSFKEVKPTVITQPNKTAPPNFGPEPKPTLAELQAIDRAAKGSHLESVKGGGPTILSQGYISPTEKVIKSLPQPVQGVLKDVGEGFHNFLSDWLPSFTKTENDRIIERAIDLEKAGVPTERATQISIADVKSNSMGLDAIKAKQKLKELNLNDVEKKALRGTGLFSRTTGENLQRGLDVTSIIPIGALENVAGKELINLLKNAKTEEAVIDILKTHNVPEDLAKTYATKFAETKDPKIIEQGLESLQTTLKETKPATQTPSKIEQEMSKVAPKPAEVPPIKTEAPQPQDAASKLVQAINDAKTPRAELEKAYSEARAKRAGAVEGISQQGKGKAGYIESLGKLKGELAEKPTFTPPQLTDSDVDELFNKAQQHPELNPFEKITVQSGLMDILGGKVPQQSKLDILERVYGPDLTKALTDKMTTSSVLGKIKEGILQIANMPRTIMSSFDFSFGGRQGLFAAPKYRKEFWSAWKQQFKMFGDEKAFQAAQDVIAKHPNYTLAKNSGVSFTDVGAKMSDREERFMSNWAEKLPIIGPAVKGSARSYTAFANKFRMDIFDSLVDGAMKQGLDPHNNPLLAENIANLVNNMTGRGTLGKKLESAAPLLNAFFFSPRLIASRVNLLNPVYYASQDPFVRKEALKSLVYFAGTMMTILTAAKLAGADVETDPRSSDFAKIKVGNTRVDIMGGFQQYLTLGARLITGQSKSSTTGKVTTYGEGYKAPTRLDAMLQFITNKEAPVASFITDLLKGKDATGHPITLSGELYNHIAPMILQDLIDIAKDDPTLLPLGALGVFGAGIQTYTPTKPKASAGGSSDSFFNGDLKLGQ